MSEVNADLVARLIGGLVPLLIGWAAAGYLRTRRKNVRLPKWPIIIGAVVSLAGISNTLMRFYNLNSQTPVMKVMRVEQSIDDVTEADLTLDFVQESAKAMVAEMKSKVEGFEVTPSSSIVQKDGKKMGVIRLTVEGTVPWVSVIGIVDKKIIRVTCVNSDSSEVDVRSQECANALRADFGTELDG